MVEEVESKKLEGPSLTDFFQRYWFVAVAMIFSHAMAFVVGNTIFRGNMMISLDQRANQLENRATAALNAQKPDELQAWMYAAQARHIRLLRHDIFEMRFKEMFANDWPNWANEPQFSVEDLKNSGWRSSHQ